MIYDLVLNDDSVTTSGYFIRDSLISNQQFIKSLLHGITGSKIKYSWTSQSREIILNILLRVNHRLWTRQRKNDGTDTEDYLITRIGSTIADLLIRLRAHAEEIKNSVN